MYEVVLAVVCLIDFWKKLRAPTNRVSFDLNMKIQSLGALLISFCIMSSMRNKIVNNSILCWIRTHLGHIANPFHALSNLKKVINRKCQKNCCNDKMIVFLRSHCSAISTISQLFFFVKNVRFRPVHKRSDFDSSIIFFLSLSRVC